MAVWLRVTIRSMLLAFLRWPEHRRLVFDLCTTSICSESEIVFLCG
jgi:hypothetical protein